MSGHSFDKMRCGDDKGHVFEVVHPRWWQVHRWIVWAFFCTGRVAFMFQGQLYQLRARIDWRMTAHLRAPQKKQIAREVSAARARHEALSHEAEELLDQIAEKHQVTRRKLLN
jgi:hypothetical protein